MVIHEVEAFKPLTPAATPAITLGHTGGYMMTASGDRGRVIPIFWADEKRMNKEMRVDEVESVDPGNECFITVRIGGEEWTAVVPRSQVSFDGKCTKVQAVAVGTMGQAILVTLPTGSMGTATWSIPEALLEEASS